MSLTRIYQDIELQEGSIVFLDEKATHHVARVLRAEPGQIITVFNGKGGEYQAVITRFDKRNVEVKIIEFLQPQTESPIELTLAQGIARGEKMDLIVQKAVELGVKRIIPLMTERCNVKLDSERENKRLQHWQAVAISACEQSGRNLVPEIFPPMAYDKWIVTAQQYDYCFVLSPHVQNTLSELIKKPTTIAITIGPEGGLSDREVQAALAAGFQSLKLGPRILRTETAALVALTALQCRYGDLS